MTRTLLLTLAIVHGAAAQVTEPPINQGAAAAYQALLRLRTTATVLHITAHPDDEDGGLLTWLSRNQGARTGLLTLNRGEGGANLIGAELFDALGVVRTEELLAAGRYYGVDQFFTRVTDFGFSKRMDETLELWGQENALRDCVRVIRQYRPDIIVSRFSGTPRDGHGNHQSAGFLSKEVFTAAADPQRFPEQFEEGLRAWRVKKLYISTRGNEPHTLAVDPGAYDPLLGASYRQIASLGLSFQRSQGTGVRRADPGPSPSTLQLIDSTLAKTDGENTLFDGLDTSIHGLAKLAPAMNIEADLAEIERNVAQATRYFDARQPWRVLEPHVIPALQSLRAILDRAKFDASVGNDFLFRLENKEREFVDAANKLLCLSMDVLVDPADRGGGGFFRLRDTFAVATPGQKFTLTATVVNRSALRIEPVEITLATPQGWTTEKLAGDTNGLKSQFAVTVADNAAYTRPYWSRKSEYRDHIYRIDQRKSLTLPWDAPEVMARFTYRIGGVPLTIERPAQTIYMDGPMGEQRRLLTVAPAISVTIAPRTGVVPIAARNTPIAIRVRLISNVKGAATTQTRLDPPPGWACAPAVAENSFHHEGEIQYADFRVTVPQVAAGKSYTVQAVTGHAGKQYREGYQVIAHRDLEPRHLYQPASAELTGVDVKVAASLRVGYVMGVGDDIPAALEQIGVKPQMLTAQDLATGDLSRFDTILIGIRASAVRPDYKAYNSRLLDYVKNGGNLIVQYQTPEFDEIPYGPYPFRMTPRAEEVSEEDAAITVLDPRNPVFHTPNKIAASDFANWVEERGSKFMSEWDARYKPLLECHDRDQPPQKGGMLQARYGKGTFTYAAYAFYRQLPAGVPGAYRLFANLISYGKQ